MKTAVKRLLCRWLGHRWEPRGHTGPERGTVCLRCGQKRPSPSPPTTKAASTRGGR